MRDRAAADRTAKLLLLYLREPLRFRTEVRRRAAQSLDSEVVFKLAQGRVVEFSDPMVCGESPAALREAAAAYVRQVLFRPDATPYQILGLAPGASAQAIKENFRLLMQLVHPDRQGAHALWPDAFAARANQAYAILRNQELRNRLDREESERAARTRETQRKAEAAAATPSRRWPAGVATRRPLPSAILPEWLTAGVGGFVRGHPALAAFVALLGGAVLVIGAVAWERPAESLMRDARTPSLPMASTRDGINAAAKSPEPDASNSIVDKGGGSQAPVATQAATANTGATPEIRTAASAPIFSAPDLRLPAGDAPQAARASAPVSGAIPPDAGSAPETAKSSPAPPLTVAIPVAARADASPAGTQVGTTVTAPAAMTQPLTMAEIDALSVAFVDSYDRGRIDAFAALFDASAETNLHQGRAAIRNEYDELFRLSKSRRMQLRELNWRRVGERAYAKGEIQVLISWRDGREVDQRVAVDIEVARRDGRVVITRLAHRPSVP